MTVIQSLSLAAQINLYLLLVMMGLYALLVFGWQVNILRGNAMKNPDDSVAGFSSGCCLSCGPSFT